MNKINKIILTGGLVLGLAVIVSVFVLPNITFACATCTTGCNKQCVGNAVYNFDTCGNQGDLFQQCDADQVCQNAQCVNVTCTNNSDCGVDGTTGSLFCQGNSVYQNYVAYTCNNPGTTSSSCAHTTTAQLQTACAADQVCSAGSCTAVTCSSNSDCGTDAITGDPFCQGNSVYQNYITYTCKNPGTASSSCVNSTKAQLQSTCSGNQKCSGGNCAAVACSSNSDCGTNGTTGSLFCQNNNIYQNYIAYTCNNPGTASSSCTNATTAQLQTTCTGNQTCSNGSCGNSCTSDYQERCSGNNLYWYDSCGNQQSLVQYCPNGCSGNSCTVNNCTSDYQERCQGNYLYWYDSCGNEQGQAQYCPDGCFGNSCQTYVNNASLNVTKTVRDLTTSSGWSNSTYANPSDMLMFMITLQASGQDVQNVFVRDNLPASLIYDNQLVVACTGSNGGSNNCGNGNYNYSGSIISGINLNTIYAGQTVTITYQVQVASAQNFSYGTTTLNNSVSATSSNSGYTPSASASVIVTRSTVLGASTVSTGLTNNFWTDSFFLPLLITLLGIGMWRSGMFFGIEKWLDDKNKIRRSHKAQKELSGRVSKIQKLEKV